MSMHSVCKVDNVDLLRAIRNSAKQIVFMTPGINMAISTGASVQPKVGHW